MATDKQPRILVVDDEPNIVIALDFLMQQNGFITETAHDGEEALAKAASFQPDLILLDVMMPRKDGFEVAADIRRNMEGNPVKVIFLTAKGTTRDKMDGYKAGGDIYFTKPFDNQELLDTVMEVLEFERS